MPMAIDVELPVDIFDVQIDIPLIHQVVVAQLAAARQGTQHQVAGRGVRWWQEAVPPEGHRSRSPGLDPRAPVQRWWHRPRPQAARLRTAHPQEDEGRRPARCPLRSGTHGGLHVIDSFVDGDKPSTKGAIATLAWLTTVPVSSW